jgi:hypothetical protein
MQLIVGCDANAHYNSGKILCCNISGTGNAAKHALLRQMFVLERALLLKPLAIHCARRCAAQCCKHVAFLLMISAATRTIIPIMK